MSAQLDEEVLTRIEQGSNWIGEPALHVYFSVSKSIPLTKKRVLAIASLRRAAMDCILALHRDAWPIVHFLDAE